MASYRKIGTFNFLTANTFQQHLHLLAEEYLKGDTVLIDADSAGLIFGRKSELDGKEVVSKKLAEV